MSSSEKAFKDKPQPSRCGPTAAVILVLLLIAAAASFGIHQHYVDLQAEKDLQAALELSSLRTAAADKARETAMERVRTEMAKADAAAKERDAAIKAAQESAARVAEALKAEAELKKKAEESAKLAKETEELAKLANSHAANVTAELEVLKKAHEKLANGSDD